MKPINYLKSTLSLIIILFLATSSKIDVKPIVKVSPCEQIIKYFVSKINAGGQDMEVKFMVTIDPIAKTTIAEMEGKGKKTSKMKVKECSLDEGLTLGYAIYEVQSEEEGADVDLIKIEVKDGKITISNGAPKSDDEKVSMTVDKWEILKS